MYSRKRISATQMIKSTKQNSNSLLLKQRSSAIFLQKQIKNNLSLLDSQIIQFSNNNRKEQNRSNRPGFLPTLQNFIKIRNQELEKIQCKKRNKIVQILCIVILRMNQKMNCEALDLLIYVAFILQKMDRYQYTLRQIVYRLIGILSNEIKKTVDLKRNSIGRKRLKHSITLMIGNILAYNKFKQKFEARLRRSNLIVEKTFFELLAENKSTQIKLPEEIHPSLDNYNQITINIDKASLSYSYEYPKILQSIISVNNYRFFISQINQIIVPERRCHKLGSTLRIYYFPLLIICLITCIFATIICFEISNENFINLKQNIIIYMTVQLIVLILCSLTIYLKKNQYKNPHLVFNSIKDIIQKTSKQYQQKGMFIKLQNSIQYFIIYLANDQQQQSASSSSSNQSDQFNDDTQKDQLIQQHRTSSFFLQSNFDKIDQLPDQIIESEYKEQQNIYSIRKDRSDQIIL